MTKRRTDWAATALVLACLTACSTSRGAPRGDGAAAGATGTNLGSGGASRTGTADGASDAPPEVEAATCTGARVRWGVNIHDGGKDPQALATVMSARHLSGARMDLWGNDAAYLATFRNAVMKLAAVGTTVEAILYDRYSAGQAGAGDCSADLSVVEATAYDETLSQVQAAEDLVRDFELENEVSLYSNIKTPGSSGQTAADYDVPCGRLQAANLRGMARAVADERERTGLPLRIILGTTDRSFGFLAFMQQHDVGFDVVGYHIYPWEADPPLDQDPWFGAGGPLGQLARFGLPVHVNEFHCGEIYSGTGYYAGKPAYENQAGQPVTEACLRSMAKHLAEIVHQTVANVEFVHFYEMWDEPAKAAPENRFGLMYDLATPKVNLFLATAFSGGSLAPIESTEITQRGLLTQAEIAAWAPCGAGP